jgi:hypothetical protein
VESLTARLKTALVGGPAARFVYLGNFEVERHWASGQVGLPGLTASTAVVNRMDELALLLGQPDDIVMLKAPPDDGFLDYLRALGLTLPHVVAGQRRDPSSSVTEDALADDAMVRRVASLAGFHAYLLPHGVSPLEVELADRCGLRLAAAPADVCKSVNSKVYSRRLATQLGVRQPHGWACEFVDEFTEAIEGARGLIAQGHRVGVKDAFGVSGKGIIVVNDARRLDQLHRMVTAAARKSGTDRVGLVVEQWVDKRADLAYHFTVDRDAGVHFDHVGEAIIAGGVHQGNRLPARLTAPQLDEVVGTAEAVGAALAKDGYHGAVGVDAMLDPGGGLYPLVEINARNTMLTYRSALRERLVGPDMLTLARQYPVRAGRVISFAELRGQLDGLLVARPGNEGVVINAFATVNADPHGRIYTLVNASTSERLEALDAAVSARLAVFGEEHAWRS